MSDNQAVEFVADDGSIIRACDFGRMAEPNRRYLALPDLDPIEPTDQEGVYIVRGLNLRVTLRKS
jgi:hypothetical protein